MKIKCPYCGDMFNDTKTHCPSCGAINEGVIRTSSKQPITIEELKTWYKERALPPYETTRFFIGVDYKKPRAFGIYQDKHTGNFVVYKNKNNGQRAIRYEGTDEAYAVNELYQRIKEQIIQQKRNNIEKRNGNGIVPESSAQGDLDLADRMLRFVSTIWRFMRKLFVFAGGSFLLLLLIGTVVMIVSDPPKDGYYQYKDAIYYHYDHSEPSGKTDWFIYDEQLKAWSGPISIADQPEELERNDSAKSYYLSESVPEEIDDYLFTDSLVYRDIVAGSTNRGYYSYQNTTYYHLDSSDTNDWYYFDTDDVAWYATSILPEELTHSSLAADFYYTPVWDSETQLMDFTTTDFYTTYSQQHRGQTSNWENDDDSSDYDWDSSDSWDSYDTDWDSDW